MNDKALTTREPQDLRVAQYDHPLSVSEVLQHVELVQQINKAVMKEGEHFGRIPGCGDKPTLLQPGAQKLLLTFRLNPDYDVEIVDMSHSHREYRITCKLTNGSGNFVGAGVGSASTMESKWRFRVAPKQLTDRPVPSAYWDLRKSDPAKAQELLGGKGFSTKKNDNGQWMIAEGSSDKVEHDNPADYYNTCLKMAKKRALVDAVLTRTAASDIFTQDIEEIQENLQAASAVEPAQPQPQPKAKSERYPADPSEPALVLPGVSDLRCVVLDVKEANGTTAAGKKWTAWFVSFELADGSKIEAGTFSKSIGEMAMSGMSGGRMLLVTKPGKKPGTLEIASLEPEIEDVPT